MAALQLEIQGDQSHFRFDVAGQFEPRLEPVWKEASHPPELTELREVWEIQGARLVSSDGSNATFWTEFTSFLGRLRIRGQGFPLWVRLIRDPQGANEVAWTLGPPTHERFKIEELRVETDELVPRATWNVLAPVTLVVSAVQRFADVNGIVGWHQETSSRYTPAGLEVLERRTEITTREGTSALDKARQFGVIDVRPYGGSYTYETNGPDGVEVVLTDADEPNNRVPTEAIVVSRIRQWGIHVGTTGPGTSPTEVRYGIRTRTSEDETTTIVFASARGPNARAWVEAKEPAVGVTKSEVYHEPSGRYSEASWETTSPASPTDERDQFRVQAELTGGHTDFDFEPVVGGLEPVFFEGAVLPWQLTLQVKVTRRGGEGTYDDLRLPATLPAPWVLDRNRSREQDPYVEERGADPGSTKWAREATLVYRSPRRPSRPPLAQLRGGPLVRSYYLGDAR